MNQIMPAGGGKHTLPKLPYAYNALEPYIDARTMEIHHAKHHQAYVDKLNAVLVKYPQLAEKPLEDLLRELNALQIPDGDKTAIRNHGGGHWNHSFFWTIMGSEKQIDEKLVSDIISTFGSVEEFKKLFTDTAVKTFGSGWAWLVRDGETKLQILSTANQDSPLSLDDTPLITIDVWEHAYYLKYQNRRAEYIDAWWNVLKLI